MKNRPDLIRRAADELMSIMSDNPPDYKPTEHSPPHYGVLYTFQLIWQRHVKVGRLLIPWDDTNSSHSEVALLRRTDSDSIKKTTSAKYLSRRTPRSLRSTPILILSVPCTENQLALSHCCPSLSKEARAQ